MPTSKVQSLQFKETEAHEKGFAKHFEESVKPVLEKLIELEEKYFKEKASIDPWKQKEVIGGIILLILFALFWGSGGLILGFIILGAIVASKYIFLYNLYKNTHKDLFVSSILSFFGDFSFNKYGQSREYITEKKPKTITDAKDRLEILRKSTLVQFDEHVSKDTICGVYKGIPIEFCELTLSKNTRDSKGSKSRTVVYTGLLVAIDLHVQFHGQTLIKYDKGGIGSTLKETFDMFNIFKGTLERVSLEDPDFEKQFDVYSTDQIEARYILPPDMMESIKAIPEAFNSKEVQLAFQDGMVYTLIPSTKDFFETTSFQKFEQILPDIKKILKELHSIFEMVAYLKAKPPK